VCDQLKVSLELSGPFSHVQLEMFTMIGLLLFNGTYSTNRLYRAIEVQCISRREQHNHTIEQQNNRRKKQENHTHSSAWAFWRRSPHHG